MNRHTIREDIERRAREHTPTPQSGDYIEAAIDATVAHIAAELRAAANDPTADVPWEDHVPDNPHIDVDSGVCAELAGVAAWIEHPTA